MIEVNGVRHGPSTIVSRSYDPEWNYAFPRPVRWKMGESVRVIVVDNYYWKRTVSDETFEGPLAMQKLSGEVAAVGTAAGTGLGVGAAGAD